jgi:propanol-preferring alcohol dehydrogenase
MIRLVAIRRMIMRAMLLREPGPAERRPLVLSDVPEPESGNEDVLVRVNVCGVCRTDLHVVEGDLGAFSGPIIPGHQVVGTVAALGPSSRRFRPGERIGVAWLHRTCGQCGFCTAGRENLCPSAAFTGWTVNGGYAEFVKVPEAFAYRIPELFDAAHAAPLLCAGIIGYRSLRLCGIQPGGRLGLYGFGASAHVAIQVARHWGCEVFVFTRSENNRRLAAELGAAWVGDADARPPAKMNASVLFAPAGPLVLPALEWLEKGGTLAIAGIYLSSVPPLDYAKHLYDEKVIRSVTNATRQDGEEFLNLAGQIGIRTSVRSFPLESANEALLSLKTVQGAGAVVLDAA